MPSPAQLHLSGAPSVAWPAGGARELAPLDGALLAWLVLEGPTPRARLAQLLWPDTDNKASRNSLRQRLFRLRKLIGTDLVTGSMTLALADGLTHDLEDADTVLGDTAAEDIAPGEFAQWLQTQRERRRSRVRRSLVELSEMAEQAKDWDDALTHARELLVLEPLSEDAHRRVMRLHYLAGDRTAALMSFDACEKLLKDEVGARPGAETLALLALVSESATSALVPAPSALPASVLRPPRLIGRERESRLARAALSEGRVVWIEGEAGLGKSRLLQEVAADHGGVVYCAARPGDATVPYTLLARLLRAIDGPQGDTRGALVAPPEPASRLSPEERLHALRRHLLARLHDAHAAGTRALFVDDLHFADRASLEALGWWLMSDELLPLCCALAQRPSPGDDPLLVTREALLEAVRLEVVALVPLGLEATIELVRSLALPGIDESALARHLHRHSGGNPLFMLETLRHAWAAGSLASHGREGGPALPTPTGVARVVERRLAQLSPAAMRLARCAAVAGVDLSIDLASAVLETPVLDLADPWRELEQAQVLHEGAFAHDLIYEATLASVPQVIARRLHAQIADHLERHGAEPAQLTRHWLAAHQWHQAAKAGQQAAQRAQDQGRIEEAAALLDEAAQSAHQAQDPALRFEALRRRAVLLSRFEFGLRAVEAIDALDAAAGNDRQRLQTAALRLSLHIMRHENNAAVAAAPAAWEQARALGDAALEIDIARCWAAALGGLRRAEEAVEKLKPYALRIASVDDGELRFEYWLGFALQLDQAGRLRDALAAWDEAAAVAQGSGRADIAWQARANRSATKAKMGLVCQAAEEVLEALRLARARGEVPPPRLAQTESTAAHRLRDAGRYAEALELLLHASQVWSGGQNHNELAVNEHRLAVLFQQLGQPDRARRLLVADRPGLHPGAATMRLVHRADVARQLGDDAVPILRQALQAMPDPNDIYHRMATLYATWIVPPDEGEALAASLAVWAAARERFGVALSGHVRAAACGLRQGAASRALPYVEAALRLAREHQPETFYLPELWLVAARVHDALNHKADADAALRAGHDWVMRAHRQHVPAEFQGSFLERNEVNRELLALAGRSRLSPG